MAGPNDANSPNQGLKFTYEDFLLFPDDLRRHELIEGDHYATPSPDIRHQRISGNLLVAIASWLEDHPIGEVLPVLAVILSRFDVVQPDLLYVSKERAPVLLAGEYVTGAPDLLAEIASPETRKRDETLKRHLYARSGVCEYWVVDSEIDVIRVYRRDGDAFARPVELSREAGDILTTPLLSGLEIPLARVFQD